MMDEIPVKRIEHRMSEEHLVCPECNKRLIEIGKEVVRTMEIMPEQAIVREDVYYSYACRKCKAKRYFH